MRQPLVAGNWKMHGSLQSIDALLSQIKAGIGAVSRAAVAVCPPYPYLAMVKGTLAGVPVAVGAQDVCDQDQGAYTGEVAGGMLVDVGCEYVIVGHSERRTIYGEGDAFTARKFAAARRHGLKPILCIGEQLQERADGITQDVVARQLDAVIELEGVQALADAVIAYEPVWAIGTGMTATPEQAQEVHAFIRGRIAAESAEVAHGVQILYGGSVKAANAQELFAMADIDGGLIGGASLSGEEFLAICKAAQ